MEINELYNRYKTQYLVAIDTRNIPVNALFFALKGDNFNGNTFAEKALALGARFAIVDEASAKTNEQIILVDDVLTTLQELANYHRKQLQIPVIGLTGSNGKTTTKELIHAVLSQKYNTLATKGNLNNHIGVPLTLLSIHPSHEMVIVEMGANHQQEIAFLSSICEPDFGYITNFGKAHLEGFGGVEGVIKGKSELYDFLRKHHKIAFVNPSDAIQVAKTNDMNAVHLDLDNITFLGVNPFVKVTYHDLEIQTQLMGDYNFANIAVAITIGAHFGVSANAIKSALENYVPANHRSQVLKTSNNTIFLDAYNANPSSMKAALENFASLEVSHKTIILGDMFELGDESAQEHQAIVDLASHLKFETAFFIGENFYKTQTKLPQFSDYETFENHLSQHPLIGKTVLIKGSRGMKLERVLGKI